MLLSHRVPYAQIESDEQFDILLELLLKHRKAIDELCFFSEKINLACSPLDRFAANCAVMARRTAQLRSTGFSNIGINMLSTLGHIDDVAEDISEVVLPVIVGHDGRASASCPCPNSPEYRAYIQDKYRLAAKADPDFIWVDDDFRLHSHGIEYGCFCPVCVHRFDPAIRDREGLLNSLQSQDGGETRERWIRNNAAVLEELAVLIEAAVHGIDRKIQIGLMTAGPSFSTYSGLAFQQWLTALKGSKVRPGGGYYNDYEPLEMLTKTFDTEQQCASYPSFATDIQYELENFPCLGLDKSVTSLLNECTFAIGAGCNGVAFSSLRNSRGPLLENDRIYSALTHERRIWEQYVELAGGLPITGLWPAASNHAMAEREIHEGEDWFLQSGDYRIGWFAHFAQTGIPITAVPDNATGTLLSGRFAECLSDDDLIHILSHGVIMDSAALGILWRRGFGHLTGVKTGQCYTNRMSEKLADHPLNGAYGGDERWVSQAYYASTAHELMPVGDGVEILSRLIRDDGADRGPCVTLFTNELGGRTAVSGFLPWSNLTSFGKRAQMIALADWISRGHLPLLIDEPSRIFPLVRMSPDGHNAALILLNTSYDHTGPTRLVIRATLTKAAQLTAEGKIDLEIACSGNESVLTIPDLTPWKAMVLAASS